METRVSIDTPANLVQAAFLALPDPLRLLFACALFLAIATAGLKVLYELGKWLSDL